MEQNINGNSNSYLGYVVDSDDKFITVVLPSKPMGKLKHKLPQHDDKKIDAYFYEQYELCAFNIMFDEHGAVTAWCKAKVSDLCSTTYFLAYLADGRILADDCKTYKLYNSPTLINKRRGDYYDSHLQYLLCSPSSPANNIKLYIKDKVIYGVETCEDYHYRDSWSVEDALFKYLSTYDRYYNSQNTGSVRMVNSKKDSVGTSNMMDGLIAAANKADPNK